MRGLKVRWAENKCNTKLPHIGFLQAVGNHYSIIMSVGCMITLLGGDRQALKGNGWRCVNRRWEEGGNGTR